VKTKFRRVAAATAFAACVCFASLSFGQQPVGGQFPPMNQGPAAGLPAAGAPAGALPGGPNRMAPTQIGVNGIAVVDIAYIFKKHNRFDQEMKALKGRVEAAETDLKRMGDEIKKKQDQLKAYDQQKTFAPGSPEYKRLEEQILKDTGDFNLKRSLQGKEFMEQEGKLYFKVSLEIDDAVKLIATRNNIALVLKFNGDDVDANDRNDILRNINKPIVYFDKNMDITPFVLQELNRSAPVAGPGGPMPATGMVPQPQRR
jgi:Skp family chaperone for outer membrane proteins